MNGGAYNVLINTTSKPVASFAACLAVISYIATGVVSAATAISYLQVHRRTPEPGCFGALVLVLLCVEPLVLMWVFYYVFGCWRRLGVLLALSRYEGPGMRFLPQPGTVLHGVKGGLFFQTLRSLGTDFQEQLRGAWVLGFFCLMGDVLVHPCV